ncbi:hypothetical protein JCGZ_18939 [Jatropha curcas]|uniref:Bet v I/Major latex protein domain-containing protein n=1 Tax=Jatropha curcas TaxID=180498 RepID=A0A067K7R6_JATCU|nr:hypothetical protein JCGZ_18939 [Jatropha curcas]
MFKVFALEDATIIPKIIPQAIESIEILEGNGGDRLKYVKDRIDTIDKDNFTYSYTTMKSTL